jgi:hypothetical protein
MRIHWSLARVWLVGCEAVAVVAFVVAVNRLSAATALVSYPTGVTPMAWSKLVGFLHMAILAGGAGLVGLVPAAWQAARPATRGPAGSEPVSLRHEWGALLCRMGDHRWHHDTDAEDGTPVIVCVRCGHTEVTPTQVMARIGWPGHQNS